MLTADALAEVEVEALRFLSAMHADPAEPPSTAALCKRATGHLPLFAPLILEATLSWHGGGWRIYIRHSTSPDRARWLAGHELGHWWYRRIRAPFIGAELEARCDAFGAHLVAPRAAFLGAVQELDHQVYALAKAFHTTQALALLRLGETTGRPVRVVGERERVRGESFEWPDLDLCLKGKVRKIAHPIRLADEGKWGVMASRG